MATSTYAASVLRTWLRPLGELPLLGLLILMGGGLFVLAQRPLNYSIAIGREDGPGSDLPFIDGWNTAEVANGLTYRWTSEDSHVRLSGLPRDLLAIKLRLLPATAHPQLGTGLTTVATPDVPLTTLPMARQDRVLHLLLPPGAVRAGRLDLLVRAPTWTPPNDPRVLGVPIGDLQIVQVGANGAGQWLLGLAPVPTVLLWPLLVLPVVWLPLRRWGPARHRCAVLALLGSALLLATFAADRLRFALAGPPALVGLGWGLLLAIGLRACGGLLRRRLHVTPSDHLLNALALLFFILFALRYAGRLYPFSMPGDLGFHVNRQNDVIRGNLLLVSRHRGIDFPYPSALYVLLLPLRLLPITPEALVEFADALFGALGLFPVAYLAWCGFRNERITLLSAAVYALLAPAIMALWWSFLPHIFAQELAVLLLAGIVGGWAMLGTMRGVVLATAGLTFLFTSHFGFYLNVSLLLGVLAVAVLLRRVGSAEYMGRWTSYLGGNQRGDRRAALGLVVAFGLAQVIVLLLFYSAYIPLFVDKLGAFQQGGMGAVQGGRAATPPGLLLRSLWQIGLGAHYATIAAPLALLGGYRLLSGRVHSMLSLLWSITLVVVVVQGAVPFVTSSTISTRWLSFAAWIVAIGLGLLLHTIWSRGRVGQVLALAVLAWLGWTTLWMWVQALAYRVRPPEPF